MPDTTDPRYELTLACGDTVSSSWLPKIGAYRKCIHCDARYRVTSITDRQTATASVAPTPELARAIMRDTAYGYASAYGYTAQQLAFISSEITRWLASPYKMTTSEAESLLRRIKLMADRGTQEASDALRRYDARVEAFETSAQQGLNAVLQSDLTGNPSSPKE